MSENVLSLEDFRRPSPEGENPCIVTLYFRPFVDEHRQNQIYIIPVRAKDGDFQSVIDGVRSSGGIFAPEARENRAWFLPWPPAAISIHVTDAETGEMIPLSGTP